MRRPGLVGSILLSYRDLRGGMAAFLAQNPRDSQLLVLALLAAVIGFIAGLPNAVVQARTLEAEDPLTAVLSVRLFAALFMTPLMLFTVAALSHLVARMFGGSGTFWSARAALIWAVIVALPLVLLSGMVSGVAALWPGTALGALSAGTSVVLSLSFFWIWSQHLAEAEGFIRAGRVFALILVICGILVFFSAFL